MSSPAEDNVVCSSDVQYREQHVNKSKNVEGKSSLMLTSAELILQITTPTSRRVAIPLTDIQDLQVNAASITRVRFLMRARLRQKPPITYIFEFDSEDALNEMKTQMSQRLSPSSQPPVSKQESTSTL